MPMLLAYGLALLSSKRTGSRVFGIVINVPESASSSGTSGGSDGSLKKRTKLFLFAPTRPANLII